MKKSKSNLRKIIFITASVILICLVGYMILISDKFLDEGISGNVISDGGEYGTTATTIYVSDYGDGTCRNDASPNDNVEQAIAAASTGDTVIVPSGNCNWTNTVGIPSDKKITLQGAGIGNTIISVGNVAAVNIGTSGSRVTGFEFNKATTVEAILFAASTGWRVDHCEFDFRTAGGKGDGINALNTGLYYPTWELSGLVDNCVFYDARNLASGSAVPGAGISAFAIWSAPTDIGGSSAVYFEDNIFNLERFGNLMDGNYGGVFVFRFNTVNKGVYNGDVVGAHSLQSMSDSGTKLINHYFLYVS